MSTTTYPAAVCTCGDCTACEFALARRLRKVRVQDPSRKPGRMASDDPVTKAARSRVLAIAAKTGLPIRHVDEALREGRTEAELLALAG